MTRPFRREIDIINTLKLKKKNVTSRKQPNPGYPFHRRKCYILATARSGKMPFPDLFCHRAAQMRGSNPGKIHMQEIAKYWEKPNPRDCHIPENATSHPDIIFFPFDGCHMINFLSLTSKGCLDSLNAKSVHRIKFCYLQNGCWCKEGRDMALVTGDGATELVLCFVFQASLVQAHGLIIQRGHSLLCVATWA